MKIIQLFILFIIMVSVPASAVTGRNPTGVNINSNGTSTVFITFHNLETNEVPVDAFWCGDVTSSGVVVGSNPCVAGTLLGHLPKRNDFSKITGDSTTTGGGGGGGDFSFSPLGSRAPTSNSLASPKNLTDIMSIPTAVIRRAYQQAKKGKSSEFFYIRQFVNNGISTYVTVTCRMGGGGARTPLSLTRVNLDFEGNGSRKAITLIKQSSTPSEFSAEVNFNGSGLLKGRWEIVMPGDVEPSSFDLLSEASLPATERPLQKRYRLLSRFQKFLSPNGKVTIQGPDPKLLPTMEKGLYRILFRVEASNDKEGNSDTLAGVIHTGGVAGFAMPTLRYFVGETEAFKNTKSYSPITLLLPHTKIIDASQTKFTWFELKDSSEVVIYKVEFYEANGENKLIASAFVKPGESTYQPVEKVLEKLKQPFLWKVSALNADGKELSSSQLRLLSIR